MAAQRLVCEARQKGEQLGRSEGGGNSLGRAVGVVCLRTKVSGQEKEPPQA